MDRTQDCNIRKQMKKNTKRKKKEQMALRKNEKEKTNGMDP